jgi:hypothetical protein
MIPESARRSSKRGSWTAGCQFVFQLLAVAILSTLQLGAANRQNYPGSVPTAIAHDMIAPRLSSVSGSVIYLPFIERPPVATPMPQLFHVPYFPVADVFGQAFEKMMVFWFGRVTPTNNYTDVRLGYNDQALFIDVAVIDRSLWYNPTPDTGNLTAWDAVSFYLDTTGVAGDRPATTSYQFVSQLSPGWGESRTAYQAAYRGNGSDWMTSTFPFTTTADWRGSINSATEARGWTTRLTIPFSSLGLSQRPNDGQLWSFAVALHDRDDAAGTPIPEQLWPPGAQSLDQGTWGKVSFGLPNDTPLAATPQGTTDLRQGLNGVVVQDSAAGGSSVCGAGLDFWTQWGLQVYNGLGSFNVQNQLDVADWPCFSKYYITFPLDSLSTGKTVMSATLTLHQFGNAGGGVGQTPYPSLIQVFTVGDDWTPTTLSWNSAPLPLENVGRAWVDPLATFPAWPGVARTWDLTRAVSTAYAHAQPLRLALYSADWAYHSGKYFTTSEAGDWDAVGRPTLQVMWGIHQ